MLDGISEIRLDEVHPELSHRIRALAEFLSETTLRVTAGLRTVAEQDALYAQGRTKPGEIVTSAKGTQSNHVLGYAVDLVVMRDDGGLDWTDHPWAALALQFGLRSGSEWGDWPHLELIEVPPEPTLEMQQAFLAGGLAAAWELVPTSAT